MSAATEAAFAAAVVDPAAPVPAGVRARTPEAAASRLAVYRNTVAVSLASALAARFPVVERLVGEAFFRAMARAFLAERRPASPILAEWGDDLPDFIEAFPPAASVPYLADMARLERAVSRAYHAADVAPLPVAALATLPGDRLGEVRIAPHPAAAVVASRHPVGSIREAHRHAAVQPVADWGPETVLVARPALEVRVGILPPADGRFAAGLLAGASLGEAAASAFEVDDAFDFGRALTGLAAAGIFSDFHLPDTTPDDGRQP